MKIKTLIIIGIFTIAFIIFSIVQLVESKPTPNSMQDIINDCKNLAVEETAECLRDNVKTFFIYNESNVPRSFQEIRNYGGICADWSKFYVNLSRSLGYKSEVRETRTHAVAYISDGLYGCILDQTAKVKCSDNITALIENFIDNYVDDPSIWSVEDLKNNSAYQEALIQATKDLQDGIN